MMVLFDKYIHRSADIYLYTVLFIVFPLYNQQLLQVLFQSMFTIFFTNWMYQGFALLNYDELESTVSLNPYFSKTYYYFKNILLQRKK